MTTQCDPVGDAPGSLARRLVPRLAARHDLPRGPIAEPAWPGVMNEVCVVGDPGERYVLRARTGPEALAEFETEAWCAAAARGVGMATPPILFTGIERGTSYSIQEAIEGDSGENRRSDALWGFLGECARTIATIDLRGAPDPLFSRFGRNLPTAWLEHLSYNLDHLTTEDPLLALGAYEVDDLDSLRLLVAGIGRRPIGQGLSHGDLSLRNLIVPADGRPVLIDWGSARTGPVPATDLINLLRNRDEQQNPTDSEIDAFITGYGDDPDILTVSRDLRVLHCLDIGRWARDRRPDRVDAAVGDIRRAIAHRESTAPSANRKKEVR